MGGGAGQEAANRSSAFRPSTPSPERRADDERRAAVWSQFMRYDMTMLEARILVDRVGAADGCEWHERSRHVRMALARRYWEAELGGRRQRCCMEDEDVRWEAVQDQWRLKWEERERRWMDEEDCLWETWTAARWKIAVEVEAEVLDRYRQMPGWTEERWKEEGTKREERLRLKEEDPVDARRGVWRMEADVWQELVRMKERRERRKGTPIATGSEDAVRSRSPRGHFDGFSCRSPRCLLQDPAFVVTFELLPVDF